MLQDRTVLVIGRGSGIAGAVVHVVSTVSARTCGLAKGLAPIMPSDGSFVLFSGASGRKSGPGFLAVGTTNGAVDTLTNTYLTGVSLNVDGGEPLV